MAIIKKNELIQMDEKSMNGKLKELKIELVKINAQISMGTMPENPGKIKEIRKTIARINTIKKIKEGKKQV
jgi:large subunit ribosomal protein L29